MRRRLNIACGVLHRPRIVLLDEPTVGVDPQSRDRIYDMLAELAQSGVSLLADDPPPRRSRGALFAHGDHRSRQSDRRGTLPELVEQTVGRHRLVTLRLDAPLDDRSPPLRCRRTAPW